MSELLSPRTESTNSPTGRPHTVRSANAILETSRRLVAITDDTLFGDTEFALRDQAQGIVAAAYAEHLPQKVATPPAPSTAPLSKTRPFHGYRPKTVETLGGPVTCRRDSYRGVCSKAVAPGTNGSDRPRNASHRGWNDSPRSAGRLPTASRREPRLLKETAGIVLSESTVQRTTEATGERIAEDVQKGRTFGGKVVWNWFRDACSRTVGYIESGPLQGLDPDGRGADVLAPSTVGLQTEPERLTHARIVVDDQGGPSGVGCGEHGTRLRLVGV